VDGAARAEVPYPSCLLPVCSDPTDYAAYLFLPPGVLPGDYAFDSGNPSAGGGWKYAPGVGMDSRPSPMWMATAWSK
jgi:hypothetical protein